MRPLNVQWYMKAAAAVQKAEQCSCIICDEKIRSTTQMSLDHFFKRVDRVEPSKEPEPVPSTSGMNETSACLRLLLLMTLQLYHLRPTLPPPVSNSSCLFTQCQPPCAIYCIVPLYFSTSCKIKNICLFLCIICVKTITNLL